MDLSLKFMTVTCVAPTMCIEVCLIDEITHARRHNKIPVWRQSLQNNIK